MTMILVAESAALLLLFLLSAFFSSAETALFSLNPIQIHRIRRHAPGTARRIEEILATPNRLLSTILVGNTFVNVAAAGIGFALAESLFRGRGEVVAIPVMTLALLIFGEVAPKRLAVSRPERLAAAYVPLLATLIKALAPVRGAVEAVACCFHRETQPQNRALTEDEFRTVVEVGEEEGVLDREERTMVDGIIRLEETQASDIMTPRVDLVGIDLEDPLDVSMETARHARFRYLPVYSGSPDHPEGFVDVPRFLLSTDQDLGKAMVPPFSVPETAPLDTLLQTFQREKRRVAFVVDEFGGTAGLVTRGDILEEIVEDVDNEYGEKQLTIQKTGPARWFVDGATSIEDVNYELDLSLEADGADRIAGWVAAQVERIPRLGEVVEAQGCRASVQRRRKNRITLVQLEKLPPDEDEPWSEA